MPHVLLFFSVILGKCSQGLLQLIVVLVPDMLQPVGRRKEGECVDDASFVPEVADIDIAPTYLPSGIEGMKVGVLVDNSSEERLSFDRNALVEGGAHLGRHFPLTHSFHDYDRWNPGCVYREVEETLTWAERGMPKTELRRVPLWPNSDQEKSEPGLIFLAVHRARYLNDRLGSLKIAWK